MDYKGVKMKLLLAYYAAIKKIIKHKIVVFKIGRKLEVGIFRLLKHDVSKFHPTELKYYVHKFELNDCSEDLEEKGWAHHLVNNDHHIEYWLKDKNKEADMTFICIKEMIADWVAASVVYSGKYPIAGEWEWGNNNIVNKLRLLTYDVNGGDSPRTRALIILSQNKLITDEQYFAAIQ
jgi:hypothetical protein